MESEITEDIGEEVIGMLKELAVILDKIKREKENVKMCPFAYGCEYRTDKLGGRNGGK